MSNRFVYIMKNQRNGYFKLGLSKDPIYREHTLQAEEPEIELILHAPGTKKDEEALHAMFSDSRLRGEWFKLNNSQVIKVFEFMIELWKQNTLRESRELRAKGLPA